MTPGVAVCCLLCSYWAFQVVSRRLRVRAQREEVSHYRRKPGRWRLVVLGTLEDFAIQAPTRSLPLPRIGGRRNLVRVARAKVLPQAACMYFTKWYNIYHFVHIIGARHDRVQLPAVLFEPIANTSLGAAQRLAEIS